MKIVSLITIFSSMLLVACSSKEAANEKNFSAAIEKDIKKPICFLYNLGNDPSMTDYLISKNVLVKNPDDSYQVKEEWRENLHGNGALCVNFFHVDSIVEFTPPEQVDALTISKVKYTMKINTDDAPSWIKDIVSLNQSMVKAEEDMARPFNSRTENATLYLTNNGWEVK